MKTEKEIKEVFELIENGEDERFEEIVGFKPYNQSVISRLIKWVLEEEIAGEDFAKSEE